MGNHLDNSNLRQEKKYILSINELNNFEKKLIYFGFKLNHSHNKLNNIYFDDLGFSSAVQNINGDLFRSKHRIRWYNDNNNYVLEEKIKKSSSGCKLKINLKSKSLFDALNEVEEMTNKKPVVQNSYNRSYYIYKKSRITIDKNIRFKLPKMTFEKVYLNSIIEVKYNTEDLIDLNAIFNNFSQLSKFSKYLEGLKSFNLI